MAFAKYYFYKKKLNIWHSSVELAAGLWYNEVKDGGIIACIEGNIYYTIACGQCHHTCDKISNLLRTWVLAPNFRFF